MTTKNYYRLKLAIFIFTFIAVIVIFIGFMDTRWFRYMEEDGDYTQSMNEGFTASIDKIDIDIVPYLVTIESHDSDEILVEADIKNSEYEDPLTAKISGGTLTIEHPKNVGRGTSWNFFGWKSRSIGKGSIIVKVPTGSMYTYDIRGVNSDITMYVVSTSTSIDTVNGTVTLYAPIERLTVNTVNGSIYVVADSTSKNISLDMVNGSMHISLLDTIGYSIDFDTLNGSLIDDYNNNRFKGSRSNYSRGDASLKITADSVNGSLQLDDW